MGSPSKLRGLALTVLGFSVSMCLAYSFKFLNAYFELGIGHPIDVFITVIICIPFFLGVSVLSRSLSSRKNNDTNT